MNPLFPKGYGQVVFQDYAKDKVLTCIHPYSHRQAVSDTEPEGTPWVVCVMCGACAQCEESPDGDTA